MSSPGCAGLLEVQYALGRLQLLGYTLLHNRPVSCKHAQQVGITCPAWQALFVSCCCAAAVSGHVYLLCPGSSGWHDVPDHAGQAHL